VGGTGIADKSWIDIYKSSLATPLHWVA